MTLHRLIVPFVLATALLATLLATPSTATPATVRPAPVITVVATDYRLTLPDTLPAGPTAFRLVNRGRELHQLYLVRLEGGKSAADLVAALRAAGKAGGPPPAWAIDAGGPNGVDPGRTSPPTTVPLRAGHYAALCVIPSPDGVPHVMKGMIRDLTVAAGAMAAAAAPAPRLTIALADYGFGASAPLTAGTHRILVKNDGAQSHELELAKLLPGKTPADLAAWAEKMAGPPPAHFLGGVSPIAPGQANELALTLTPGHYVMLCFVPDAKDGKPHVAHGMVRDFVVQ